MKNLANVAVVIILCGLFVCAVATVIWEWRKDRQRIKESRRIANRMIDEYEARDGARIGQFKRFKI